MAQKARSRSSFVLPLLSQVEPARKVQQLTAAAQDAVTSITQHLLLLDVQQQQQQQACSGSGVQLACQVQQVWDACQQASSATGGQQGQADASSSSAVSDAHSHADTVAELHRLASTLDALQRLLLQQQQQHVLHVQQQQLSDVSARAAELLQDLCSPAGSSTAGRFEWVDGSLTTAIQQGSWVLLDNANLVNPTVLDRLNGLLEPGGVLQLDEAGGSSTGGGRVVVPHPGFRLLLAYDPKHGEVSRAMRNRGVELYMLPPAAQATAAAAAAPAVAAASEDSTQQVRARAESVASGCQVFAHGRCCRG
jgi:midasin